MVECPYCNRAAMTLWRKSALGPGRVVRCQSCGKKVAAHWVAIFAAIPAFIGGMVLMKSDEAFAYWGLYTVSGRRTFDEMAGMVPLAAAPAGVFFAVCAVVASWRSSVTRRRSRSA